MNRLDELLEMAQCAKINIENLGEIGPLGSNVVYVVLKEQIYTIVDILTSIEEKEDKND